jgi:hypothetical protein
VYLVHEEPVVGLRQRLLGLDDAVQVRVQQLHDDVQLVVHLSQEEVLERDDVLVLAQVPAQTRSMPVLDPLTGEVK